MRRQAALEKTLHTLRREFSVRLAASSALRLAMHCGAAFSGAFVLAGIGLLGRAVPAALALLAAMPFSLAAVSVFFGAAVGYLAFWGAAGAFEMTAAGFLILAELCIFSDLLPREKKWFLPASACALYALIALLNLLSGGARMREALFLLTRLALLAVCTYVFSEALTEKSRAGRGFLALCLLAGCSGIHLPGGVALSMIFGSGAVFLALSGERALLYAAACGLTLDLTCGGQMSMTAAFSLAALVCRTLPEKRGLRAAMFAACCISCALFSGAADGAMLAGCLLGLPLGLLMPESLRRAVQERQPPAFEARMQALRRAGEVMNEVSRMLGRACIRDSEPQSAAVFDRAAEQICRTCARWDICWQEHAEQTYFALSGAGRRIFARGAAEKEDFPAEFLARCCFADGFVTAVNEALDEQRLRRQYHARLRESRTVVADQFRYLARLTQGAAEQPEHAETPENAYVPELGYRARGVRGGDVSGDHGSCFSYGEWYYVLLCDGMGTGEAASRESASAIRFLSELILSGFEPQDAMQMLSGVYLLRGDGGFSTIDLLQVSLVTGEGFLHKWGAAASYLKRPRATMRLGTPTPPPGVGGHSRPECLRVSLGGGEVLILVSDGVDTERAEAWLKQSASRSPRELASGVLACGGADTDDRTALAFCLRPAAVRRRKRSIRERAAVRFRL